MLDEGDDNENDYEEIDESALGDCRGGGANSNQQCDIRCLCTAIEEETGSASEEKPIYQSP